MTDRVRQVVVTVSAVFMIVGTLFGIGVIGTRVEDSAGGSFAATATLIAPAARAFSIWSVIYVGLVAYTLLQWLPGQTSSPRQRAIGWLAAASMVLNGAWLLVAQAGWLWASVVVIVGLVVTLGELVRRLTAQPRSARIESLIVDGTFGLYLGWTAVATTANVTATLVASGVAPARPVAELLAVVVLAVAAMIGVVLARVLGARIAIALAMGWGLAWIAVGRLTGEPSSSLVGVAAALAAAVVVVTTVVLRLRPAAGFVPARIDRVGAQR